jgi:hypothetical protein
MTWCPALKKKTCRRYISCNGKKMHRNGHGPYIDVDGWVRDRMKGKLIDNLIKYMYDF